MSGKPTNVLSVCDFNIFEKKHIPNPIKSHENPLKVGLVSITPHYPPLNSRWSTVVSIRVMCQRHPLVVVEAINPDWIILDIVFTCFYPQMVNLGKWGMDSSMVHIWLRKVSPDLHTTKFSSFPLKVAPFEWSVLISFPIGPFTEVCLWHCGQ